MIVGVVGIVPPVIKIVGIASVKQVAGVSNLMCRDHRSASWLHHNIVMCGTEAAPHSSTYCCVRQDVIHSDHEDFCPISEDATPAILNLQKKLRNS